MKYYDFISIKEKGIHGLKNPILVVSGIIQKKEFKFLVFEDGQEIPFDEKNFSEGTFIIESKLLVNSKNVEIYIVIDNKKHLILKIKNWLPGRIKTKLKSVIIRFSRFIKKIPIIIRLLVNGLKYFWKKYHFLVPINLWGKYFKELVFKVKSLNVSLYNPFDQKDYEFWCKYCEEKPVYGDLKYKPLISVLIPVYNISKYYLNECINSILSQYYDNYEIILADDCSTNLETIEALKEYESNSKIKVIYRKTNGHISAATNTALKEASGEFVALIDNDDVISTNALYEMVKVLNNDKNVDMIYSDEDKLNLDGKRCDPNFKSDFAPDSFLSSNYICHFTILRTSIMREIKGFRVGYEGAQDYDLFLRFTEKTNKIHHISKILYHWRMIPGSTSMSIDNKNYAIERGKKAIEDALIRRKIDAIVHIHEKVPYYYIEYKYKKEPKISIIIPTKDYSDTLRVCLNSIYEKTTYKNYEIIVVNNNSVEEDTFSLFNEYKTNHSNFEVIDANFEFNYSKINNLAIKKLKGEYIMLLNNDTEIITNNWLEIMVGYAMQKHIGAVGAKLLYPDETVQHAGVVLGLGGIASHVGVNSYKDEVGMYGRLVVPYNYSAVTAACLMVEKKKFNEVKGFEEKLMVAYNDIDFNIKLLNKGYYNICLPQVLLIHHESKSRGLDSTPDKYKRFLFESSYMHNKWGEILQNDKFYNKNCSLRGYLMLDKKEK